MRKSLRVIIWPPNPSQEKINISSNNRTVASGLPSNENYSIAPIFAWTSFSENASTTLLPPANEIAGR